MAASSVRSLRQLLRPCSPLRPCFRNMMREPEPWQKKYVTQAVIFTLGAGSAMLLYHSAPRLIAITPKGKKDGEGRSTAKLTSRERRFMKFASVQYEGQLYMTPQDFLESVTEAEPRPRLKRVELTKKEVNHLLNHTPAVRKSTPQLFRNLKDKGIISYTEYLFLLSILTKPQTGFRIAFNMFDTDNNQKVDKHEFLVLLMILGKFYWKEKPHRHPRFGGKVEILERIFSYARRAREKAKQEKNAGRSSESSRETEEALDEILYSENVNDTTLMVHFFGMKGNGYLGYEDFHRFMDNLQTEVLQLEFNEFSRGQPTISEMDFAKILLRYTLLHADDYDDYIQHLSTRIPNQKGITFDEYKTFCQFLNNLDDFAIAMRMYTYADQPISQEEFIRAVRISMGRGLGEHLVNTVFQIFDENNDGQLSYKDFIAIMRDRLHRGIKSHLQKHEGWDAFKACIKEEMKASM